MPAFREALDHPKPSGPSQAMAGPAVVSGLLPCGVVAVLSLAYLLTYPLHIGRADESHLLYGAKRVLDGDVIYRDFVEILTPLSYYLFAAVYWVAGTTLLAARVGIALIQALGCAALFYLVRRVSGTAEAILAALVFAGICIPTWPYASPHWISTVLGLLIAAVTLSERGRQSSRLRPLAAGVLAGVAVCAQQQRGAFLTLWVPLALCVLSLSVPRSARWRRLVGELAWSVAGTASVVLIVLGSAAWASSVANVRYWIFEYALTNYAAEFSGQSRWGGIPPLTNTWRTFTWPWLLRISPLFLAAEGVALLSGGLRRRERRELERACLWLLAAFMALAIWYLPDFIHVSFVLPFLLVPGAALLDRLRSVRVWTRVPAIPHAVTAAVWLSTVIVAGKCVANVAAAHAIAPERVETGFGTLRLNAAMARQFRAVRNHLVREPDGRALFYSYPDDAWLYLALPADNPTRFSVLLPRVFSPAHLQEAVEVVRAKRPGTVLLAVIFSFEALKDAIDAGYDAVEEVEGYRIYVRRRQQSRTEPHAVPAAAIR